jgi:TRAP-type uncharacterized transport system fused permease subunit
MAILGIPYLHVALAAVIPAILYFYRAGYIFAKNMIGQCPKNAERPAF